MCGVSRLAWSLVGRARILRANAIEYRAGPANRLTRRIEVATARGQLAETVLRGAQSGFFQLDNKCELVELALELSKMRNGIVWSWIESIGKTGLPLHRHVGICLKTNYVCSARIFAFGLEISLRSAIGARPSTRTTGLAGNLQPVE